MFSLNKRKSLVFCYQFYFTKSSYTEQIMMDCIAEKPTCSGKTITSFRFWMLQMALMDKIMSKCVALNTNDLKTVLLETITDPSLYIDSVGSDPSVPCAVKIHNYCVHQYIGNLRTSRFDICTAVEGLNSCYARGSLDCDAAIIQDFVKILSKVATRVIQVLRTNLPQLCRNEL
ncbi:hypothetical protein QZH41_012742 [Actinostola sp. cb2023]|nr:hypothetical protein QZH41_012742 [Actinostola sp. cb2023]